jgi:hypothetical protein
LAQARDEEDPHRPGPLAAFRARQDRRRGEEREGDGRQGLAADDHRPPADAVGEPSPQRRRQELGEGEAREQQADGEGVGAEVLGVERQQRQHQSVAQHVDEGRDHQDPEPP